LYVFAGYSAENLQRKRATIMDWVFRPRLGFQLYSWVFQPSGPGPRSWKNLLAIFYFWVISGIQLPA